jgi:hypothetical protein
MSLILVCLASWLPHPAPEWDALFQQRDGWIGADGAYSVLVGPNRVLWLFSDTWVGKVRDGKRTDATIVNNSLALQEGFDPATAKVEYWIRRDAAGKPEAFLKPDDGRGWFWLHAGALVEGKLYLFLLQIERTAGTGVFSFKQIGEWLGIVDNPNDHPWRWRIRQKKLPFAVFTEARHVAFGAATLVEGGELFVYGTQVTPGRRNESELVIAKVNVRQVEDFSAWSFWYQGTWQRDPTRLDALVPGMAAEFSVHRQPGQNECTLVYTERGLSPRILRRTAPTPTGPWTSSVVLYTCPEMQRDKNLFTYAAKAHPEISPSGRLLVTYVVNSLDFWQVARDASLYWPRFVSVPAK